MADPAYVKKFMDEFDYRSGLLNVQCEIIADNHEEIQDLKAELNDNAFQLSALQDEIDRLCGTIQDIADVVNEPLSSQTDIEDLRTTLHRVSATLEQSSGADVSDEEEAPDDADQSESESPEEDFNDTSSPSWSYDNTSYEHNYRRR